MADINNPSLLAREDELNQALVLLHFAFRTVIARPDAILESHGLSRVHHRILYFVGRNPSLSVNDLLKILGVSRQSLNGPLQQLIGMSLIQAEPDERDSRIKRLSLSKSGQSLETILSGDQRQRFAKVFSDLGSKDEAAWRRVMARLAEN
jgi:DNA-binding MarR family transcriptional regulator